jgi:hypothetical protein
MDSKSKDLYMSGIWQRNETIKKIKEEINDSLLTLQQIYAEFAYLPHAYRDNTIYEKINEFHSTLGALLNAAISGNQEHEQEFSRLTEQENTEYRNRLQRLIERITAARGGNSIARYGQVQSNMAMQNRGDEQNLNKYSTITLSSEEKNMLIAAVFSESSPLDYITVNEIAGITAVILNRTLEGFLNSKSVKETITMPSQVNGITKKEYRYAMSKLDSSSPLSKEDELLFSPGDIIYNDRKLTVVIDAVNKVLEGKISDPAYSLGDGKGALHWGSRDDYNNKGGIFKDARENRMGTVITEGEAPYGTFFFRGN